ncbi:MAG: cation:proton antiporter subunit C [Ectothiorhodospiraceae bacterium AqS1]|nr:cation:proton antiporter subunit C [Ectothiorhodospiraceae bacterium AqS1]
MVDNILGAYAWWGSISLLSIGLYVVMASRNYIKKVMGLSIFQSGVFIMYIQIGAMEGATAPIVDPAHSLYANPLTHVLILTAIVVGVATAALALALVVRIHAAWGTIEEDDIVRATKREEAER